MSAVKSEGKSGLQITHTTSWNLATCFFFCVNLSLSIPLSVLLLFDSPPCPQVLLHPAQHHKLPSPPHPAILALPHARNVSGLPLPVTQGHSAGLAASHMALNMPPLSPPALSFYLFLYVSQAVASRVLLQSSLVRVLTHVCLVPVCTGLSKEVSRSSQDPGHTFPFLTNLQQPHHLHHPLGPLPIVPRNLRYLLTVQCQDRERVSHYFVSTLWPSTPHTAEATLK